MEEWDRCLEVATKAHKGQKRWNGDDYITHPLRVANVFNDYELKCIAILHDVTEDTSETVSSLRFKSIPLNIIRTVNIISKKTGENYKDYILRVKKDKQATKIKIADLEDNLLDLKSGSLKDKYLLALHLLRYSP